MKKIIKMISLGTIMIAPMAVTISCNSKKNLSVKLADISPKTKQFLSDNGIKDFSNNDYLIYMGSTGCPFCRKLLTGNEKWNPGGGFADTKGPLRHIINFLDDKGIDFKTIESESPKDEVLPWTKDQNGEVFDSDFVKGLSYLKKDKIIPSHSIPILIIYNHKTKTFTSIFNNSIPSESELKKEINKYIK